VQVAAQVVYKIAEHFQLVQAQAFQSLWDQVLPKCQRTQHHPTTGQIQYLDLLQPTVAVVVDHGTAMQVVLEVQAVVVVRVQTDLDQTLILDRMTVEIKITVGAEL
jgi:hypothetical protein